MQRIVARFAVLAVVVVAALSGCAEETGRAPAEDTSRTSGASEEGAGREAGSGEESPESVGEGTVSTGEPAGEQACEPGEAADGSEEILLGEFAPPEGDLVPEYEVLREEFEGRDGACVARLLVDTASRSRDDFTLITREVKAGYSEYDAASIEFTDTTGLFSHNGSALIFNTPRGATYLGYIYDLPNNEGYVVASSE
ncbi:MAG: hypothetical protein H0V53_08210 [Rubrobacter sp.]|nr:hypothetical protein [Rubrobacter sp.]